MLINNSTVLGSELVNIVNTVVPTLFIYQSLLINNLKNDSELVHQ